MPQLFRIGSYIIYFWANENNPTEPIHVHIAEGIPKADATKIWLTQTGHCVLANNNSHISNVILKRIIEQIEANSDYIKLQWIEMFGEIKYFC